MNPENLEYAGGRPKKGCLAGCVILGVLALVALSLYGSFTRSYNTLVDKDQAVQKAWAEVDNQLQRRSDLIPNLVGTVKGIAGHEEKVFGRIADARSRMGQAGEGPSEARMQASNDLSAAVRDLFLVVRESYPQLASSQNFLALQDSVEGTENRLAHAREQYNRTVEDYNRTVKSFPMTLFVGMTHFKREQPYFRPPAEARERPNVDFAK